MTRNPIYLILFCLFFPFLTGPLCAENNNSETKLREALRNTILQLRTAQNERAVLQASQAESDQKIKALTSQVDSLTKRATAAEKAAGDQETQLAKFKDALEKWEAAYKEAAELASAKESARAKLAGDVIALQRQVADQQSRNAAMFRIGNEILTRYEHFGLGDALAAKEPFIGLTRVKLENLVQEYQDKLVDAKIKASGKNPSHKQDTATAGALGTTQPPNDKLPEQHGKP